MSLQRRGIAGDIRFIYHYVLLRNMEMIAKISKGSKMDQVYLPKNRIGMPIGQFVIIALLENKIQQKKAFKPYFYNVKNLEPLKLEIIEKIFNALEDTTPENIIITGSFLERGFRFNDIDVLVVNEEKIDYQRIKEKIEEITGIKGHIILLNAKTLISGLSTDPLYNMMLSKCVSKNRLIFNVKRKMDYKILDYQLLKSKTLIDNFDFLNGAEKYYLTLNMISILLFIKNKKISKDKVNKVIEKVFSIKIAELKENIIEKGKYVKKYLETYNKIFNLIMKEIK